MQTTEKCPDCGYPLNLREKQNRYKCSKCGKVHFPWRAKAINFVRENKRRREEEWQAAHKGGTRGKRVSREEARKRNLESHKRWYQKNKDKILAKKKKYYELHRDTIVNQKREYRLKQSEQDKKIENEKRKARRYKNIDDTRFQGRLNYWKQQQKALAVEMYENGLLEAYRPQITTFLPTMQYSELLTQPKPF